MKWILVGLCLLGTNACGGDEDVMEDVTENDDSVPVVGNTITEVELTFTPSDGGSTEVASWSDPDGDGVPSSSDGVLLESGISYRLAAEFLTQSGDITGEIQSAGAEYQVFFLGASVQSEATAGVTSPLISITYDDRDGNGNPVGLSATAIGGSPGNGVLRLVLQNLANQKSASLAADVAANGVAALPGQTEVDAEFAVEVF
ncbi:MAG: hypothetical protein AAF654_06295 [Myxococcota bacterium]